MEQKSKNTIKFDKNLMQNPSAEYTIAKYNEAQQANRLGQYVISGAAIQGANKQGDKK